MHQRIEYICRCWGRKGRESAPGEEGKVRGRLHKTAKMKPLGARRGSGNWKATKRGRLELLCLGISTGAVLVWESSGNHRIQVGISDFPKG